MASENNNSTELPILFQVDIIHNIKFVLYTALEPPALICNFILLYYLIFNRTLRRSLHHHSILALLVVSLLTNLFDTPRLIHFVHIGFVVPQTNISCLIWQWYDYILFGHSNVLLLWASVERYLIIFHGSIFNTAKGRLYFHYIPLFAIIVYLILFYTIAIFFTPCNQFDFGAVLCGIPCYTSQLIISLYDNVVHNWLPLGFSIFLSIVLILRVLYRNRTGLQPQVQRRKHLKIVIQLVIISSLHIASVLPYSIVIFIQVVANLPDFASYIQNTYFFYFFYLFMLLQPFVCMGCLPEVVSTIKKTWKKPIKYNGTVMPTNLNRTDHSRY